MKVGDRCPLCNENHDIEDFVFFLQQTLEERSKLLYKRKLCYGCFEEVTKEHNVKSCANRRICKVCNGKHPTTLHGYVRKKKQNDNQKNDSADTPNEVDVKCATVNTGGNVISMCVVPVNLTYGCSRKTVKTHALLDSCSQGIFMLEKLLQDLGVNGEKTSITIKTVNGDLNNKTTVVEGLKVSSSKYEDGEWIELPKTFAKKYLPVDQDDIATPSKLKQWKYLEGIMDKISKRDDLSVGLLIGANCTKALEPLNIIPSCDNGPYAFQTTLGWCVVGPVNRGN